MAFGVTFAPTADQAVMGPQRGQQEGTEQVLQTLSLRLPKGQLGQGAIAPRSLLDASMPQEETPDQQIMRQIIRKILESRGMVGGQPIGQGMTPPTTVAPPTITPGEGPGTVSPPMTTLPELPAYDELPPLDSWKPGTMLY